MKTNTQEEMNLDKEPSSTSLVLEGFLVSWVGRLPQC